MNEIVTNFLNKAVEITEQLQKEYSQKEDLLLTEGDLECELYYRLLLQFNEILDIKGNIENNRTKTVHSQVTWFKPGHRSGFEIDLTILDPKCLKIKHFDEVAIWPNKGFFYEGPVLGIELKFIRDFNNMSYANEDYYKAIQRLIPAIRANIKNGIFNNMNEKDFGIMIIVGCKTDEIFERAINVLNRALHNLKCPESIMPIIFSPNKFSRLY